ncbi:ATP-dependent 6-phosphofructokinase 4, chloroplastic-like isoform X2 [Pyrus communis]|uniref:ATP-dependent 6-phosphofructokinase 4, chloroplastic-like isoform X2 n=1 Tax=Pyrus communis TaxID=23211 RepID=UPI0035C12D0D
MIYKEVEKCGLQVAVAGIPETVDKDIAVIDKSFGFNAAVEEILRAINAAHVEVESVENGVGILKLMGKQSGMCLLMDCCLIPESPFYLEGHGALFEFVEEQLKKNGHVVIVLAGAGQEYVAREINVVDGKDASGNKLLLDVGLWLTQKIKDHFTKILKMAINMKYIGFSGFRVTPVSSKHAYIPIARATEKQNTVILTDRMWARLLASTNQPSFLDDGEVQDKVDEEDVDLIKNKMIATSS